MSCKYTRMSICIWYLYFFFLHLKNNFIKNAQNWSECWTQKWNTWFHSAKSTVYNQYHRSREWLIRSAGAYNEGWRKEGRQQTGGEDTMEKEPRLIWANTSVDERCQSRRVEFAANNQGQTHNLPPLNIPGGLEQTPFLCFATFQSSQAQIWLCPRQIHPEPHLRKTPAASVNAALSPETPAGPNKSQIGCNLEYRESI